MVFIAIAKKLIHKQIYIVVSLIFMMLPFLWAPLSYSVTIEEAYFPDYGVLLDNASYSWADIYGAGSVTAPNNNSLIIPNSVFYYVFTKLGFSHSLAQRIFISTTIFFIALFFYLFSRVFTKKNYVSAIGLTIYFLSWYVAKSFGYTAKVFQLILLPAFFYLVYNYIKEGNKKYLFINCIIVFLFQALFTNLPQALATFLMYPLAIIYRYFIGEKSCSIRTCIKYFMFILVSIIPIVFYQGLVYFYSVLDSYKNNMPSYSFTAFYSSISRIFQFRGAWWEFSGYLGVPYDNLNVFTENKLIILVSLLIPALVFWIMLKYFYVTSNRNKKVIIFWFGCFLFFVGLSSGFVFFPGLYSWIFSRSKIFMLFREPWAKFFPLVLLSFSALVISIFDGVNEIFKDTKIRNIFCAIFVALVLIKSFYFFSPMFFFQSNKGWRQVLVRIPDYWYSYQEWTREFKDESVLPLPYFKNVSDRYYNWYSNVEKGNSSLVIPAVLGRSKVFAYGAEDAVSSVMQAFLSKGNFNVLNLVKVDYILLQKDVKLLSNVDYYENQVAPLKEYVQDGPLRVFGDRLFVYKIKPEFSLPHFYVPDKVIAFAGEINDLPDIVSLEKSRGSRLVIISMEGLQGENFVGDYVISAKPVEIPIDLNKLKWNEGWAWPPDTNNNPAMWNYLLVRLKEEIALWRAGNTLDKVDVLVWLATKKATEVRSFDNVSKVKWLENCVSRFSRAVDLLKSVPEESRGDDYWGYAGKTLLYMRRVKDELALVEDASFDMTGFLEMYLSYEEWLKDISNTYCKEGYCYDFSPPISGRYLIYLTNLKDFYLGAVATVVVTDQEGEEVYNRFLNVDSEGKAFVQLDNLQGGEDYKISVQLPDGENFLGRSFWRTTKVDVYEDGGIEFKADPVFREAIAIDSNAPIFIDDNLNSTGVIAKIDNWYPGESYKVHFDYLPSKGALKIALFEKFYYYDYSLDEQKLGWRVNFISSLSLSSKEMGSFTKIVKASENAQEAYLYLYFEPIVALTEGFSITDSFALKISNVAVKQMPEPVLLIGRDITSGYVLPDWEKPNIEYHKVNPTKYFVNVRGGIAPFMLVFNESYNKNWRVYMEGDKTSSLVRLCNKLAEKVEIFDMSSLVCSAFSNIEKESIAEEEHYLVNGFANAWYIEPKMFGNISSNYELVVEYTPQRIFVVSRILQLVVFTFSVMCLLFSCFKSGISHFIYKKNVKKSK